MLVLSLCLGAAGLAPSARAQPSPGAVRGPWALGVSQSAQSLASRLYEEGNAEFGELRFAQALEKYRMAIQHWDHPGIRFNMAVCLITLHQRLEARDNLERALAYGAAPLTEKLYAEGLIYRDRLDATLARVTIICDEPDAEVTLDGKPLFTGRSEATLYQLPGDHQIVAMKPGFLTTSETLTLTAGTPVTFRVRLVAFQSATSMLRRWPRWKPFAMAGAGGLMAGLGALAYLAAANNYAAYDTGVRSACPNGCSSLQLAELITLRDAKDRAGMQQTAAVSCFAAGGALLAAGAVALYLNQPRAQLVSMHPMTTVAPAPGGALLTISGHF